MMKKLEKKLIFENATDFRLEYLENGEKKKKEFTSYKIMEQFHSRQKKFLYLDLHRYAYIDGKWHRFIKLNSPFVFEKELAFLNKIFYENIEAKNTQGLNDEE
ncbi:hypothetical protein [uncultured Chryseobacterium sp.]|uniref:hypothetical protein n=1 Tax=uncultured Chryseobacterium sp. TaxID=259322 RepID=UPI0025EAE7BF|nr:hypothetical protein [uncultured Chryseobacterium sp.]